MTRVEEELLDGRARVVNIIEDLHNELDAGAQWENHTLSRYLDSLAALLDSIENVYANAGHAMPTDPWILIDDALQGAPNYE